MKSIKATIKKYFITSIIVISLLCGLLACFVVNGFKRMFILEEVWAMTIVIGAFYSILWMETLSNIIFDAQWFDVIYNDELHQPVWTNAMPMVITFSCIGIIGYLILSFMKLEKTPPLITVLGISAVCWHIGMYNLEHSDFYSG